MAKIKYEEIKLRSASLKLVDTCNAIITSYQQQGYTLTLRQLYYQLVSRDIIVNSQKEYKRVGSIINDARLAGMMDWSALEDRTRNVHSVGHWTSPDSIIRAVAVAYQEDKWENQDTRPEVWIEKEALAGVVDDVCARLDVSYFSCKGYTSQSEMWGAAQRFINFARRGQTTRIIHLGDHDPSGQDMSRDIEERITKFMSHHGYSNYFEFTRIALNRDQIDEYDPPPNPAKSTDSRFEQYLAEFGDESWELDALEPQVIVQLIRKEVDSMRDEELWAESKEAEERNRFLLTQVHSRWSEVVKFIEKRAKK